MGVQLAARASAAAALATDRRARRHAHRQHHRRAGGLEAVLDWEVVHVGDPMEDLGLDLRHLLALRRGRQAGRRLRQPRRAVRRLRGGERRGGGRRAGALVGGDGHAALGHELRDVRPRVPQGDRSVEKAAISRRTSETAIDLWPSWPPRRATDMREQPSAAELIDAVAEFITRDLAPTLTGRLAFHARVAANVLAIVRRELTLGPAADRADAARLTALLGTEGENPRADRGALPPHRDRRDRRRRPGADRAPLGHDTGDARRRPARLRHLPAYRGGGGRDRPGEAACHPPDLPRESGDPGFLNHEPHERFEEAAVSLACSCGS